MQTAPYQPNPSRPTLPMSEIRRGAEADLLKAKMAYTQLQSRERELRTVLAARVATLQYAAALAADKLAKGAYADGFVCLDIDFDRMKDAESELAAVVSEMELTRLEAGDLERDLADVALWKEVA